MDGAININRAFDHQRPPNAARTMPRFLPRWRVLRDATARCAKSVAKPISARRGARDAQRYLSKMR